MADKHVGVGELINYIKISRFFVFGWSWRLEDTPSIYTPLTLIPLMGGYIHILCSIAFNFQCANYYHAPDN